MKLTSELLLYQLLTQLLPGFDHEREALGAPLLDTQFRTMGMCRVHDQCHSVVHALSTWYDLGPLPPEGPHGVTREYHAC